MMVFALSARFAVAQTDLKITLKGGNPTVLECPAAYVEPGATVSGGTPPYDLEITGAVNAHMPGTYTIKYRATDAAGHVATTTRTVIVEDTTPPEVDTSVAIDLLWPPNHNLINVGLDARIHDACDSSPKVRVMVFGDEDDEEQTGDGHHSPDAKNIWFRTLRLRSERKGNADGRVYMIVVTATDDSGNTGFDASVVVVPHDKSKRSMSSIARQAAAIRARREAFAKYMIGGGALPSGYYVIGDGPTLGPKQ